MNRPQCAVGFAVAGLLLLGACSDPPTESESPEADAAAMGHIHGLGVDPADDTLYAATHFGLFRIADGEASRVADRSQDTMAFTVIGNRHFLGSGYPDQREDLPAHLGLIESTDAGETWKPLALQGEADFHALEPSGDILYALDAVTGSLMATNDRRTFRTVTRIDAVDLAADPNTPGRVLATTPNGLVSLDAGTGATETLDAPALAYLDWPQRDLLVGLGPAGQAHTSADGGATWDTAGSVPGDAAALEVTASTWYAATS